MAINHAQQAVAAKIRVRYGRFFTPSDYASLAASAGLLEFLNSLREHPDFREALSQTGDFSHRDSIEHIFTWHLYEDLASLFRFDRFLGSPLYKVICDYLTVDWILSFVRHYNAGTLDHFTPSLPRFFTDHMDPDYEALSQARNFSELIPIFTAHPYMEALAAAIPTGNAPIDLTVLEFQLMDRYYRQVFELFAADKKNYKDAEAIVRVMVDVDNLQKILRLKRYYADEIGSAAFLEGGTISPKQLTQWCSLSYDALLDAISKSGYGRYLQEDLPPDFALKQVLYDHCRKHIRSQTQVPALLIAYMVLSRLRRECLVTVFEGIRYGMTPGAITALLPIR